MGRAKTNRKRSHAAMMPSAERKAGDSRDNNAVVKRSGTERPDAATSSPVTPADPVARVIKTQS